MRAGRGSLLRRAFREEGGQVVPFVALLTVLFLGMAGLTIDLGKAFVCYRELQASTDAAALAAGYELGQSTASTASVQAAAALYGASSTSTPTGLNVNPNLAGTTISTVLKCSTTVKAMGILCTASVTGNNVAVVTQTVTINTIFIRALAALPFGKNPVKTLTLSATSTAVMRGSTGTQYNVAVVLDSTGSMSSGDNGNCPKGTTKEVCALEGIQTLLSGLTPCGQGSTSSTCNSSFDTVGVFTFPNVQANTASSATTCTSSSPQGMPYSVPAIGAPWPSSFGGTAPNYEITSGFLSNYSSNNAAGGSIAATSPLGILTGADPNGTKKAPCNGLTTPISNQGTYLAGAIYAAQSALVAAQTANTGSKNALVILTDGDANASNAFTDASGNVLSTKTKPVALTTTGIYPSMIDQCQQAISAAQYAANNNTSVYVVAYGALTSGCNTDASGFKNPCSNLQAMALKAGAVSPYTPYAPYFYSDASSTAGSCPSPANPGLTLNQIFQSVSGSFTQARLFPNGLP